MEKRHPRYYRPPGCRPRVKLSRGAKYIAWTEMKTRAGILVKRAIKSGQLKPAHNFKCVECHWKWASVYDHRDYSQPLNVDPVCYSCNTIRGSAIQMHDKKWSAWRKIAPVPRLMPKRTRKPTAKGSVMAKQIVMTLNTLTKKISDFQKRVENAARNGRSIEKIINENVSISLMHLRAACLQCEEYDKKYFPKETEDAEPQQPAQQEAQDGI